MFIVPTIEHSKEVSSEYADFLGALKGDKDGFLDTRYIKSSVDRAVKAICDEKAPLSIKITTGMWLFRKILRYYPLRDKTQKKNVIDSLEKGLRECEHVVPKGTYLHYHDEQALQSICEKFYLSRFGEEKYFVLQMLNDVQLIRTTLHSPKMKEHFLKWIKQVIHYDQQCNLLDVLLRFYSNDPEIVNIRLKLEGANKLTNLYTNLQNAHDEDITKETYIALGKLMDWYEKNPFEGHDIPEDLGPFFHAQKAVSKLKTSSQVAQRAQIDTTIFPCGDRSVTIQEAFCAVIRYILLSPHKEGLFQRLEEEFAEANGLCSSGYINRFMNTLQGFSDEFTIRIPFPVQLHATITHWLSERMKSASDSEIEGSYSLEFRENFFRLVANLINLKLSTLFSQYGEEDVSQHLVDVVKKICFGKEDPQGWNWKFENGMLSFLKPSERL
jgi:hypothetical protein